MRGPRCETLTDLDGLGVSLRPRGTDCLEHPFNVSVKLTSDEETFYQTTDRDGFFQFDRLRPGHWTVTVDDSQLPRFHYLERDVFEVDLEPGERIDLLIKVFVKRRPIQLIGEGELQLKLGGEEDTP